MRLRWLGFHSFRRPRRRRRWHSRTTPKPKEKKRVRRWPLLVVAIAAALLALQGFQHMEKQLRAPLMNLAKIKIKKIAAEAINAAITDRVSAGADAERLVDWQTDRQGKVIGLSINYNEHMKISRQTKEAVTDTLREMTKISEGIPLGQAFDSAIIASFGPRVPVRFTPMGAAFVELKTRQQQTGINMVLVEVYVKVKAEIVIIIPFDTEPEVVEAEVPLSYALIVGDVPMYYFDGKGNPIGNGGGAAPNIALPMLRNP